MRARRQVFYRKGFFRRSRTAMRILSGSCFRRSLNSYSPQPKRRNSSATIRPPLAAAVSRRHSPAGCWPNLPSIRANGSWRNAALPTYQPRRKAWSVSSSPGSKRRASIGSSKRGLPAGVPCALKVRAKVNPETKEYMG